MLQTQLTSAVLVCAVTCCAVLCCVTTGKAWCDTAYLVDLVAAGLVARDGSGATTPQLSQAQLLQGIAGVLGDADMTLVLQDYRAVSLYSVV